MEDQIQHLVDKVWKKFKDIDASKRYLVAVAGIPGSGKTTAARVIVGHLNQLHHSDFEQKWPNSPKYRANHSHPSHPDIATAIPLDGFHLPRTALSAMPDPDEAHYRRGAAFTFDPKGYLQLIEKLRRPIEAATRTIHAPSFDHAIKDPVENDIHIPPTSRIIVLEGLYVALDRDIWREASSLADEIWFIETDIDTAKQRVAERNFKAGLSPTFDAALERTENSDMRNAREIIAELVPNVTEIIKSIEDPTWQDPKPGSAPNTKDEVSGGALQGGDARKNSQAIADDDGDDNAGDADAPERPGPRERMDSIAELAVAGAGM